MPRHIAIIFVVTCFSGAGCIAAALLRPALTEVIEAQAPILDGTDTLDEACQTAQHDAVGLARCRDARAKVRAGLIRQNDAIKGMVKK